MKKIIPLFALAFIFASASAAVPLRWTVETSRAAPAQFEAYQGETLALEAALMSYGKPLEAPSNYSLYWQTNGMGSTYWSVPCSQTFEHSEHSNILYATWSPTNDVGARVYNCFIGQPGTIYHAAFQLRLRQSPGATPNELPLPQKVIDFAKVTVLNPPWSGGGGGGVDTNAVREIAREEIGAATNGIPEQIAALQDEKRDKTDLKIMAVDRNCLLPEYKNEKFIVKYVGNNRWTITPDFPGVEPVGYAVAGPDATELESTDCSPSVFVNGTWRAALDTLALASQLPSADQLLTAEQREEISDVANKFDKTGGRIGPTDETGESVLPQTVVRIGRDAAHGLGSGGKLTIASGTSSGGDIIVSAGSQDDVATLDVFGDIYENSGEIRVHRGFSAGTDNGHLLITHTGDENETLTDRIRRDAGSLVSTNNQAFVSAVRSIMPTTLRAYDPVRQCWWNIQPVNGVLTLTVED